MFVHKIYTMIVNHSLTMITSCNKMVNFNYATTSVALALSEQLLCNWQLTLMRKIMPHVWLGKGP